MLRMLNNSFRQYHSDFKLWHTTHELFSLWHIYFGCRENMVLLEKRVTKAYLNAQSYTIYVYIDCICFPIQLR